MVNCLTEKNIFSKQIILSKSFRFYQNLSGNIWLQFSQTISFRKRVYFLWDFTLNNKIEIPLQSYSDCMWHYFLFTTWGLAGISNFPLLQILCCFNLKNTKARIASIPLKLLNLSKLFFLLNLYDVAVLVPLMLI